MTFYQTTRPEQAVDRNSKANKFVESSASVVCEIIDGNTDTISGALLDQWIDVAFIKGPNHRCRSHAISGVVALRLAVSY
jgi:hypothetical protein